MAVARVQQRLVQTARRPSGTARRAGAPIAATARAVSAAVGQDRDPRRRSERAQSASVGDAAASRAYGPAARREAA